MTYTNMNELLSAQGFERNREFPEELKVILNKIKESPEAEIETIERALSVCVAYINLRRMNYLKWKINVSPSLNRFLREKPENNAYREFLDHYYTVTVENGIRKLIGEPYHISFDEIKEIIEFCNEYNLEANQSWWHPPLHYPNHTIPIVFTKIDDKAKP